MTFVIVEVLNDVVTHTNSPSASLPVLFTIVPLLVDVVSALPCPMVVPPMDPELEHDPANVHTEMLDIMPSIIPPLGNPAPNEVHVDLQATSEDFRPRRFE